MRSPWCVLVLECCKSGRVISEMRGSELKCVSRKRSVVSNGRRGEKEFSRCTSRYAVVDSRIEAQQRCFDFDMCCGQSSLS